MFYYKNILLCYYTFKEMYDEYIKHNKEQRSVALYGTTYMIHDYTCTYMYILYIHVHVHVHTCTNMFTYVHTVHVHVHAHTYTKVGFKFRICSIIIM